MRVFRISQTRSAHELVASGVEGRWNSKGQKVIYTGGSAALSCLEVAVHKSGASLTSGDFSIATIEFPDSLIIKEITVDELIAVNSKWFEASNALFTRNIGDEWLKSLDSPILRVPSAIIPFEFNYLLNVNHPESGSVIVQNVAKFIFDPRLKM